MMPRPRFKMPLWVAAALVAAAFLARSAVRGFDFALDLPSDALVLGLFVAVIAGVAWVRADNARRDDAGPDAPTEDTTDPES